MTVNDFVTYVMSNPANTNPSVARAMLEELFNESATVNTVLDYVLTTPANTNYSVLKMWLEVLKGETPSPTPDPDPDPEPEPGTPAVLSLVNIDSPSLTQGIVSINYEGVDVAVGAGTTTYDLLVNQEFTVTYHPGDELTARYTLKPDEGVTQVERLAENKIKFKMASATGEVMYVTDVGESSGDDNPTS